MRISLHWLLTKPSTLEIISLLPLRGRISNTRRATRPAEDGTKWTLSGCYLQSLARSYHPLGPPRLGIRLILQEHSSCTDSGTTQHFNHDNHQWWSTYCSDNNRARYSQSAQSLTSSRMLMGTFSPAEWGYKHLQLHFC